MGVFGGLVCRIVVCNMVLSGLEVETEETVCGLVEVTSISEVGDTEEVEKEGIDVTKEV